MLDDGVVEERMAEEIAGVRETGERKSAEAERHAENRQRPAAAAQTQLVHREELPPERAAGKEETSGQERM